MKKNSSAYLLLATGMAFSFLVVIAFPTAYFKGDLMTFWKWTQPWDANWRSIFVTCAGCNYPILGMIASAGLMSLFSAQGFDSAVFSFRLVLALLDGLNILLVFWMLKRLDVKNPAFLAGLIGVLISSWAGGALWGQVDGFSQFFILLALAWMVTKNTAARPWIGWRYALYLAGAALLIGCALLTKQLTVFSAFSLGLLLAADILFSTRAWKGFILKSILALAFLLAAVFAFDPFLKLKPPYFSHLHYIWKEGVYQAGIISGNGFNIWMLLGRDMWSSARVTLISGISRANPYLLGLGLFLVFLALITTSLILSLRQTFQRGERFLNQEVLLNFILHLALVNLCFNVFLTGTRERYLFHFYPFALMALAGLGAYSRVFSEKLFALFTLGGCLYGLFVLQILSRIDFHLGTLTHQFMAVIHLILFTCLLVATLKYQNFLVKLVDIFRKKPKNLPTVR